MSQLDKLKKRLVRLPNDFSWGELQKLLGAMGYREHQSGKTSGSCVKFVHGEHPPIMFHKPHPKPTLKAYQIKQLMAVLKERGQL